MAAMALAMVASSAPVMAQQLKPLPQIQEDAARAQDANPPFLGGFLKQTRIVYPLQLGNWQAEGEHVYDNQEAGVSIGYRDPAHSDRLITVYFYPAGVVGEEVLKQAVDASISDIESNLGIAGGYADIQMQDPQRYVHEAKAGGAEPTENHAWYVGMRTVRNGRGLHSALVLLHDRLYFVKGRLTVGEQALSISATGQLLKTFLADLLRETTVISTGDCWMPIPIVKKDPPLAVDGPGALLNVGTEAAGIAAVAYEDRVEAVDVDSVQAGAVQIMAMSMTNRMLPGCEKPSDLFHRCRRLREIRTKSRAEKHRARPRRLRPHFWFGMNPAPIGEMPTNAQACGQVHTSYAPVSDQRRCDPLS